MGRRFESINRSGNKPVSPQPTVLDFYAATQQRSNAATQQRSNAATHLTLFLLFLLHNRAGRWHVDNLCWHRADAARCFDMFRTVAVQLTLCRRLNAAVLPDLPLWRYREALFILMLSNYFLTCFAI
ncbi:hypothetical protein H2241_03975 [Pantoea ananatis]|uniref:hypothetical protein n=1 Tax=Pantoea ananas TaxID=553 RepID=UPI00158BAEF4|nr:hypothetical protein [Pantoea ananatis]MBA4820146.1 hypothetical protein [Pantoea ananatis]QKV90106.1 hypothetical protein FOB88_24750 [Pantoea ananatis]